MNVNIALIGAVSAGKSTLLNALFLEKLSDMKIKRTTMVPQVYSETDELNLVSSVEDIYKQTSEINCTIRNLLECVFSNTFLQTTHT